MAPEPEELKSGTMKSIVILNGTLCSEELWTPWIRQILPAGGPERNVFHFPGVRGRSIAELADTVGAELPAGSLLIGYSLGGIAALEILRRYGQKVQAAVLICTNARGQTPDKQRALEAQRKLCRQKGLEAVFDEILLPAYFNPVSAFPAEAQQIKRMGLALGPEVFLDQLALLETRTDQREHLHEIRTPTLLLYGETDPLCPPPMSREIARAMPQSLLIGLPAGHMLPLLQREKTADAIRGFLPPLQT